MSDARAFYDGYVARQVAVGVNDRHRAILVGLRRAGLLRGDRVLEIGCGVGTLTGLLASALDRQGSVVATDISPKSVDAARERLGAFANLQFIVGDILTVAIDGPFDVVVLPDVVEHIPLEQHNALFARIAEWLVPGGFVLLNYPNPYYLQWCHEHTPGLLQKIDQPIHADRLLADASQHGLYLHFLETYSIWVFEGDYVLAVLRRSSDARIFTQKPEQRPSLVARARRRIRRRAR